MSPVTVSASHPAGSHGEVQGAAPCVQTIDMAASVSPIAGGVREVPFSFVGYDANGATDISAVAVDLYGPDGESLLQTIDGLATSEQQDGRTIRYEGTFPMRYHDAPTDEGSAYTIRITLTDATGITSTTAIHPFDYEALAAIDYATSRLSFGAIEPGTPSEVTVLRVTNEGNVPLDASLAGTDLQHESQDATIDVSRIRFDTSGDDFQEGRTLSRNGITVSDFDLLRGPDAARDVQWYLDTPSAGDQYLPAGAYSGRITIGTFPDPDIQPTPSGGPTEPSGLCGTPQLLMDCDATPLASDPAGLAADPGFAYEDRNADGGFDEGTDVAIDRADLLDGTYVVPPERATAGLVIPASLSPLEFDGAARFAAGTRGTLHFQATLSAAEEVRLDGAGVDLRAADVESTGGTITVASTRSLRIDDARLHAQEGLALTTPSTMNTTARAADLVAHGEDITLHTGRLTAPYLAATARQTLHITASGASDLQRARLESTGAGVETLFQGTLQGACLNAHAFGDVDGLGADAYLQQATLTSQAGNARWSASALDLSHATVQARYAVQLAATTRTLAAGHAHVESTSGSVHLNGPDDLSLSRAVIDARDEVNLTSEGGAIEAFQSTVASGRGHVWIRAPTGGLDLREADVNTGGAVDLVSGGELSAARLKVTARFALTFDIGSDVTSDDLRLTSLNDHIRLHVGGTWHGSSQRVEAQAKQSIEVRLDGATSHRLAGAALRSMNGGVSIHANGPLDMETAALTAKAAMQLHSRGNLTLTNAGVESTHGDVVADLGMSSATLHVDDLHHADKDDVLMAGPAGITVNGEPRHGTVLAV